MSLKDRIRVRLKAYDHQVLDRSADDIVEAARRTGASVTRPLSSGAVMNRYKVLRSPQSDNKSRQQLELRTHKRLLDILEPSQATIDALMELDLPAGVGLEIKSFPTTVSKAINPANGATARQPGVQTLEELTRQSAHNQPKSPEVELVRRALEIIGSPEAVVRWMQTSISALNGKTPFSLLNSVAGREQIETVLGRIEHGIF